MSNKAQVAGELADPLARDDQNEEEDKENADLQARFPPEVLKTMFKYLSVEGLKNFRILNRYFFQASRPIWNLRTQVVLRDLKGIRRFGAATATTRRKLPFTVHNWTFYGVTIQRLMSHRGYIENNYIKPFWTSIHTITFANWDINTWKWEYYTPDPQRPRYRKKRKVEYQSNHKLGSTYQVIDVLRLCTNVTKLIMEYSLILNVRGQIIGPRQFPKLDKLVSFHVYYDREKYDPNIELSVSIDEFIQDKMSEKNVMEEIPGVTSGGNAIAIRILDHCPKLTSVSASSETLFSTKMELWLLARILLVEPVPKIPTPTITQLVLSIPLQKCISEGLKQKVDRLKLKSLHLRIMPGQEFQIDSNDLYGLISAFAQTLLHLEIVFMNAGCYSTVFPRSTSINLQNLKSIEMWGFSGDYNFLEDMKQLESATLGARTSELQSMEAYFKTNPLPKVKITLKTAKQFMERLNWGAILPKPILN